MSAYLRNLAVGVAYFAVLGAVMLGWAYGISWAANTETWWALSLLLVPIAVVLLAACAWIGGQIRGRP